MTTTDEPTLHERGRDSSLWPTEHGPWFPVTDLDELTRNELTPTCEATPALFSESDCPDLAGWVLRINGQGQHLATVLICADHAKACRRHIANCRECAGRLTINLEPI